MKKKQASLLWPFIFVFLFAWISFSSLAALLSEKNQTFLEEERNWRAKRDNQMRAPTSWLTIAGLFWLDEGENTFGTATENKIKLPDSSSPLYAGKFVFKKGKVTVIANEGNEFTIDNMKIKKMVLKGDDSGRPDIVELNDLRMWVIKRGGRYAIRLRDLNNPAFKEYKGLDFFPPSKKYKIEAQFISYNNQRKITIPTVIGTQTEMSSPGYVKFELEGREYKLQAFEGNAKNTKLFFIFKDETNGKESYEATRFMVSDVLENGKVDLNFNRAYNPPCAYTPYATCPLPPPQNYLQVRIEAGEKKYGETYH